MTICMDDNDNSWALDPDSVRIPFHHPDFLINTNTSCRNELQMAPVCKIKYINAPFLDCVSTRQNEISGGKDEHSSL